MSQGWSCAACGRLFPADALGEHIYAIEGEGRQVCVVCIAIAVEEAERRWLEERIRTIRREELS